MRTLLIACLLALFCGVMAENKTSDDDKVKITVYYEALCPDSMAFIRSQLASVWRDFREAVKIEMVPYGIATRDKVNGTWQFSCHHGPEECYGNKVQACILKDRDLPYTDKIDLVICLMSQSNPDKSLDTCLDKVKKSEESDKLKSCASGDQGSTLLASYGDKTDDSIGHVGQRPEHWLGPVSYVPVIVINEKYDQAIQKEVIKDLKKFVCNAATNKLSGC